MTADWTWARHVPDFSLPITVAADDIDGLGHINNVTYVRYFERVGWAHSCALGLDIEAYRNLDRAMVVRRNEIDYLQPGYLGDVLAADTWIIVNDGKASLERLFQLTRISDGALLARAHTFYTCVSFSAGRVRRMPEPFIRLYSVSR
jgi:acyl-CoA thioester hydrolase